MTSISGRNNSWGWGWRLTTKQIAYRNISCCFKLQRDVWPWNVYMGEWSSHLQWRESLYWVLYKPYYGLDEFIPYYVCSFQSFQFQIGANHSWRGWDIKSIPHDGSMGRVWYIYLLIYHKKATINVGKYIVHIYIRYRYIYSNRVEQVPCFLKTIFSQTNSRSSRDVYPKE